jgi:hypothetical protein
MESCLSNCKLRVPDLVPNSSGFPEVIWTYSAETGTTQTFGRSDAIELTLSLLMICQDKCVIDDPALARLAFRIGSVRFKMP